MNSNKYNFYKNSIYYLIANGVIFLAGIVIMCIFGFNLDTSIKSGHLIFISAFSVVIALLINFIYVGLRYDFAKAFSVIITTVHNVLLSTAIICLIRIPVSETIVMGYILLVGLTTLFTMVMTEKLKGIDLRKANYSQVIKSAIAGSIKQLVVLSAIVLAVLLLSLIISSSNVYMLAREFFVMLAVLIYSAITILLPSWCYFSSKIKRIKKPAVDAGVENQKVVQAVAIEAPINQDNSQPIEDKTENQTDKNE